MNRSDRPRPPPTTPADGRAAPRAVPKAGAGRQKPVPPAPAARSEFALPDTSPRRCPPSRRSTSWTCPTALLKTLARPGRHRAVPDPGRDPAELARRPRRPRPRPHRLRQDPRLRPRAAGPHRRAARRAPAAARPGPRAHPGARPAGHRRPHPVRPRACSLRLATVVGGMSINRQAERPARAAPRCVVATPGPPQGPHRPRRLPTGPGRASPSSTRPTRWPTWASCRRSPRCSSRCAPDGQRMLFSATLDRNIDRLVREFLHRPGRPLGRPVGGRGHHDGAPRAARRGRTDKQRRHDPDRRPRRPGDHVPGHQARRRPAGQEAAGRGVRAAALHGGKSQPQRNRPWTSSRTARSPPWSPRTSRPAASTSTTSTSSSTSTRPATTRTICTAAAAPPARASPAASSRSSCPSSGGR